MDSSLPLLQSSVANLSVGQALSLILLAIGLICVVKQIPGKRLPPGPSGWPVIGSLPLLGNMPHRSLYQLSKKYGPIMHLKLGRTNTMVVSSPKIAEACLKNDLNFSNRRSSLVTKFIGYDSFGLISIPYGPRWRLIRKICNIHIFGSKALDDLQPVREAEVGMLVKSILEHKRQGKTVNLRVLLNIYTTNVLGQIMMSKRLFDSQGPEAGQFTELVAEIMDLAGKVFIGDYVPFLAWMDLQGVQTNMKKLHIRTDEFLNQIIKEHQTASRNKGKADFLSILLADADNEERKLTNNEIKADCF